MGRKADYPSQKQVSTKTTLFTKGRGHRSPAYSKEAIQSRASKFDEVSSEEGDNNGDKEVEHSSGSGEERQLDVDEPRVARWEPEDELDTTSEPDTDDDKEEGSSRTKLNVMKGDLSSLPFGSILKARQVLDQTHTEGQLDESNSNDEDYASDKSGRKEDTTSEKPREREQYSHATKKVEKRAHKHAPLEMSSKRAVTRRRQVVEVKKVNYRDPRFSTLTGEVSSAAFQNRYSFLVDMHKAELSTLRENLKRAKNILRSSPRDQREVREEEVQRLEHAMKRAESSVNRDKREGVEREALERIQKEEKQRRKEGKSEWHMKDSAKRELLLRARHDALAETGGRFAVRKAIEKRQKKISQKEKKRIPSFVSRSAPEREAGYGNGSSNKRRRVS
ncbi:rRNA biogenesis protein RRP36 [Phellopilus nigrolimitatus]|nr:rRNA biogenesis protein RRP36 [Phellopilus nigrolimitatus]